MTSYALGIVHLLASRIYQGHTRYSSSLNPLISIPLNIPRILFAGYKGTIVRTFPLTIICSFWPAFRLSLERISLGRTNWYLLLIVTSLNPFTPLYLLVIDKNIIPPGSRGSNGYIAYVPTCSLDLLPKER